MAGADRPLPPPVGLSSPGVKPEPAADIVARRRLDAMRKRSDTRFVTITHNPITMARMDRLFGVTMAERGVSQIVSVELAEAERFLEAG